MPRNSRLRYQTKIASVSTESWALLGFERGGPASGGAAGTSPPEPMVRRVRLGIKSGQTT